MLLLCWKIIIAEWWKYPSCHWILFPLSFRRKTGCHRAEAWRQFPLFFWKCAWGHVAHRTFSPASSTLIQTWSHNRVHGRPVQSGWCDERESGRWMWNRHILQRIWYWNESEVTVFTFKHPEWSDAGMTADWWGASVLCFQDSALLLCQSSTLFPRFLEGFLISGIADVKPEVCLESVCSIWASAVIRLKQATSSIRLVTVLHR